MQRTRTGTAGIALVALAVVLAIAGPANAAASSLITQTGAIGGSDPTFSAPVPNGEDTPTTVEATGGQRYDAYRFRVTVVDNPDVAEPAEEADVFVDLETTGSAGRLCTYDDTFTASSPLDNLIVCSDTEIDGAGPDRFTEHALVAEVPSADCLTAVVSSTTAAGAFDYTLTLDPPSEMNATYRAELITADEPCEEATTTTSTSSTSTSTSTTSTTTVAAAPTASVSDTSLLRGQTATVTGTGFAPDTSVKVELQSAPLALATLTANAQGQVSGSVTIPQSATIGNHQIVLSGTGANGQAATVSVAVTVASGLPVSGANTRTTGLIALALVGLGLVVTGRSIELRLR